MNVNIRPGPHLSPAENGIFQGRAGSRIEEEIHEAIQISQQKGGSLVRFRFCESEPPLSVCGDSDPALILRDWDRASKGYISLENIGPYPAPILSDKEKANDARMERKREVRRRVFQWRKATEDLLYAIRKYLIGK